MKLTKKLDDGISNGVGDKIRARRRELNMTQQQVASLVGCSIQQIQKYEAGMSQMSVLVFLKICQVLHTHPTLFFPSFAFAEAQQNSECDGSEELERRLLSAFRSVSNLKVKERIVNLVEALISTAKI